jgi:peptidoglycan hydrolase FlgJ
MRIDATNLHLTKPAESPSSGIKAKEDEKLRDACKSFEAMLTGIMLKGMRKTVMKTDLFGSGNEEELFQEMMDNEICQTASKSNSVGISDMLYRQLSSENDEARKSTSAGTLKAAVGITDVVDVTTRFKISDLSEGGTK